MGILELKIEFNDLSKVVKDKVTTAARQLESRKQLEAEKQKKQTEESKLDGFELKESKPLVKKTIFGNAC